MVRLVIETPSRSLWRHCNVPCWFHSEIRETHSLHIPFGHSQVARLQKLHLYALSQCRGNIKIKIIVHICFMFQLSNSEHKVLTLGNMEYGRYRRHVVSSENEVGIFSHRNLPSWCFSTSMITWYLHLFYLHVSFKKMNFHFITILID